MTLSNQHEHPDSPHPNEQQPATWLANHASTLIIGFTLFATILTGTIALLNRHMKTETELILAGDKATASLLSALVDKHNQATLAVLQSYANRPRFISACQKKDNTEAVKHLSALKSSNGIDLTFVTDHAGILWTNFPSFPEAIGKDLSQREWYKGISSQWQPYTSSVFKLLVADQPLAVALCVPVYDEQESIIGILASSQRLDYIKEIIENIPLIPHSQVSIVDRTGQILYSNTYPYRQQLALHPHSADILAAVRENKSQPTFNEHPEEWDRRYHRVVPLVSSGWTVIVERSRKDIFMAEKQHFFELVFASLLLYVLILSFLAYLNKTAQFKKTANLLQAEQALRTLSVRHEALLAAVPEIIMEVDTNKVYTWANAVGIDFFGEDVVGKEASFYFESEQDTYNKVGHLFQGSEERIYVESWQRRRDGELRLLAWWCRCLKDAQGKVRGGLSSAYDITEQKHAEDKFRHIFNSSVTGISMTQLSGEVDVNPAFATMLGYETTELKNVKWQEISHSGDTETTRQAIQPLLDGKADSVRLKKRYLHKNGAIVWADVGTTLRRDNFGKPLYFISTINDISERKKAEEELRQSEAKFRALVESIPVAIYISTGEEQVGDFLNRHFTSLFGYTLEDVPDAAHWSSLAYPDAEYRRQLSEEWNKKVRQAIASQTAIDPIEVVVTCKDGKTKDIAWGFMTMGDKNYAFGLDLTERKKAEEKNKKFTEELARSNNELQQFAQIASHDLQEPLRMVSSYLQLLERRYKDRLDDDATTFIGYAVDGARRMQALLNGLLEFSRIKTHGQEFAPVHLPKVLDGVCRNLQSMIAEAGATVHYGEMPVIRGDEAQIARLFQNLLQNALKYRRKDIPSIIDIGAEKTDTDWVFIIRDNGIGIEEQYFQRIFTIFQRLHTREEYPGTGIGLSICKRIVERHDGRIWLESNPGTGTTFYFSIPGEKA